jgi:hypothetical protein
MHETIAVVFDFDDTLSPDTTSGFIAQAGLNPATFWNETVNPLYEQGWDPVPAYLYKLIELNQQGRGVVTQSALAEWGRQAPLHKGVDTLFTRLRQVVAQTNPNVAIEFYVISSGIGDILRHTAIAHEFKDIWASEFHYDEDGRAVFAKRIISFTDKTRYLFHIQKGLIGPAARTKPLDVNRKFSDDQLRVPFTNMIFIGDGLTDVPCFSLITKSGGMAVGVYDRQHESRWAKAFQFVADRRVSTLYSANYSEDSDLSHFLTMAVRNLAERVAVAKASFHP